MHFETAYLLVGLLLILAAVIRPLLARGPLSSAMVYLVIGVLMSPRFAGYLALDPVGNAEMLERVSELAVVISLFVSGLKIQVGAKDRLWRLPLRLAFVSMAFTVILVTVVGCLLLGLSLPVALILGAVLAPTDPVLASEIQVEDIKDRDKVRFSLTGEAGFNDGSAFPFLYLGLGLLGLHHLGHWWVQWWTVDVLWGILGGLGLGALFGAVAGILVRELADGDRKGVHEFLAFGLVFAAYGAATALNTHGFLAAFSAGLALRWMEKKGKGEPEDEAMAHEVLGFKERIERLLEAVTVVLVGAMVGGVDWSPSLLWFAPLLFCVLRPVAVVLGLAGSSVGPCRKAYLSWFGIRGIGSVYYLCYAINHGLPTMQAHHLASLVYPVLAISIIVHGLSVDPLMAKYGRQVEAASPQPA